MKLLKIINLTTQTEISKFYNILTAIISEIDESINLDKSTDAEHFVRTFNRPEICNKYQLELQKSIQNDVFLDILSDIIVRDGNCIMSRDWFKILVEKEIKSVKERMKFFQEILEKELEIIEFFSIVLKQHSIMIYLQAVMPKLLQMNGPFYLP